MNHRSKTTSHLKLDSDTMRNGTLRSYRGSRLQFSSLYFKDTFKTGEALFYIFFKLVLTATSSDSETRETEDQTESDTSPVPVSSFNVDDRRARCLPTQVAQVLESRSGCKNSRKIWSMMKFHYREALTPVPLMKLL